MARTTLKIDDPVLRDVRRLQQRRGQSLGQVISDLLADAVARAGAEGEPRRSDFRWIAKPMGERVDLADKEAVWSALETRDEA